MYVFLSGQRRKIRFHLRKSWASFKGKAKGDSFGREILIPPILPEVVRGPPLPWAAEACHVEGFPENSSPFGNIPGVMFKSASGKWHRKAGGAGDQGLSLSNVNVMTSPASYFWMASIVPGCFNIPLMTRVMQSGLQPRLVTALPSLPRQCAHPEDLVMFHPLESSCLLKKRENLMPRAGLSVTSRGKVLITPTLIWVHPREVK